METPVEIRYAGVVVARATEVRRMTVGGVDMFLSMPEPLPAGTVVSLGDGSQARVEKVIESQDPSVAGIYVKMLGEGEAAAPWVPCFREAEVPAPRPPAVVVSPVIVRPVHRTVTPHESASRPDPIRVEAPPPPRPEPVIRREETPEVVAVVPEPVPTVEPIADPPRAFTAPPPRPDEQIAHFEAPPEPPPAVVEGPIKRERSKRSTIVVAVAPAAEERPEGVVKRAAGEIDTGSRRINQAQAAVQSASIVVEEEPPPAPAAAAPAPEPEPEPETPKQAELRLEDLSTAKALPSARGRATKRRKTNLR